MNFTKDENGKFSVEAEFDFSLIRKNGIGSYAMIPAKDDDTDMEHIIEEWSSETERRIWDEKTDEEFVQACYDDILHELFEKEAQDSEETFHFCMECGDSLHAIQLGGEWLVYENKEYSYTLQTRPDWSNLECGCDE